MPTELLILALAGLLGSFVRAWMTRGQEILSRDTVGECFLGFIAGILWPTLGVKLVPFPSNDVLVKAALVAGIAYIAGDVIQNLIPGLLGRVAGKKPNNLIPPPRSGTMGLRPVVLLPLVLALTGCISTPAYVSCTGKGTIKHHAQVLVYAGEATTTLDCGDGLTYQQRKYAPPAPKEP